MTHVWEYPSMSCRQGNDRGTQYRSGIYYHSEEQKVLFFGNKAPFNIPTVQTIAQDFIKEAQAKYKDKIVVEVIMILQAPPLLFVLS